MNQTTIFDVLYPKYKITKPIRLIELFAGYGSQYLALKYLGANVKHYKICEWAIKSIQAYKDIHFTDDNIDYSKKYKKDELINILYSLGISQNYNEPMTFQQISRLGETQLRKIYNNIKTTRNLVNIQQVSGEYLEIKETDKYEYIMTYSFPCQDLSLAGKRKGMSDTSTRSGMLWEVERILTECKELGTLPQILLMENVPQVHSMESMPDFHKWQVRLEELGYKSYWQDLIATDYGIPQTRNRCFMISILGDYSYTFPEPIPLKLKLKDLLEDNVDEKYYLSDKMIKCFTRESNDNKFPRNERFEQALKLTNEKGIAGTITTAAGNRATDNFILIKNNNSKGYLEATVGDGIDIYSRMEHHRGTVQKGKAQTLTTQCDRGVVIGTNQYAKSDKFMQGRDRLQLGKDTSDTLQTTPKEGIVNSNLRIRKLTPLECFRLMGVKDEDYYKVAKNQSNSSLYHLAGDSIVVNVLMSIFKEMIK